MRTVIQWDPNLNVGIGLIDNQHKIIFDLIHDLGNACSAHADNKVIDTLVDVIENYIFRHFEAEESFFDGQTGSADHSLDHYNFIKEFRKVRLSFRNTKRDQNNIPAFIEQWLVKHIKNFDISMFVNISNGIDKKMSVVDEYQFGFKERRRHGRIKINNFTDTNIISSCYNTSSLKNSDALLVDISFGGVRIRTDQAFAVGDLLVLSSVLGRTFELREKVRILNEEQGEYGAEFIDLSPKTEKFLMELYGAVTLGNATNLE